MNPQTRTLPPDQHFYLVGIGGAGMSVVAHLLHDMGYRVSGSDRNAADTLPELRRLGIEIFIGHDAAHVPLDAIVVVTSAVHDDNPEYARAQELGLEIWHRSEALAFCTRSHDLVAVAGAHGKTTTSSMISHALLTCGLDPSFAIGGVIASLHTGARLGKGRAFVIEADESDGSFLNYSPYVEVITNIEADHLDHWGSVAAFEQVFADFISRLRPEGHLVMCADDAGVRRVLSRLETVPHLVSYGFDASLAHSEVSITLSEARLDPGAAGALLTVQQGDKTLFSRSFTLQVGGRHMLLNAAGAVGAAASLGLNLDEFLSALETFTGAERRLEFLGTVDGVRLYDDYGHHPTEVAATLEAARALGGSGCLIVCFQPHLYSRTQTFCRDFARVFAAADALVTCGVYAAREEPIPGVNGNSISDLMGDNATFVEDMYAAGAAAFNQAKPGDLLLFLGAGDITHVGRDLVKEGRPRLVKP